MNPRMLEIKNLSANGGDKPILKNISLTIGAGETHAIMGRNGSGKSSLAKVLVGHPSYTVTTGRASLSYAGGQTTDLLSLSVEERSHEGLYLAPQYPTEIPGLSIRSFLKTATNAYRKSKHLKELDTHDFNLVLEEKVAELSYNPDFLDRSFNVGFSGGEKKRNEILQISLLEPQFVFLDEIDSGLDIDALNLVLSQIESLKTPHRSFVFITHYANVIESLKPSFIHIMDGGQIIESSSDPFLARRIQKEGFDFLLKDGGRPS